MFESTLDSLLYIARGACSESNSGNELDIGGSNEPRDAARMKSEDKVDWDDAKHGDANALGEESIMERNHGGARVRCLLLLTIILLIVLCMQPT